MARQIVRNATITFAGQSLVCDEVEVVNFEPPKESKPEIVVTSATFSGVFDEVVVYDRRRWKAFIRRLNRLRKTKSRNDA